MHHETKRFGHFLFGKSELRSFALAQTAQFASDDDFREATMTSMGIFDRKHGEKHKESEIKGEYIEK